MHEGLSLTRELTVSPFLYRFLILRKKPTLRKLLCSIVVVVGLFICLIPTVFPSIDPKAKKTKNEAHGVSRVMWPIIFMLGFVSVSLYRLRAAPSSLRNNPSRQHNCFVCIQCRFPLLTKTAQYYLVDHASSGAGASDIQ